MTEYPKILTVFPPTIRDKSMIIFLSSLQLEGLSPMQTDEKMKEVYGERYEEAKERYIKGNNE